MANELRGLSALDPRVAATNKFIQDKQIPPDKVEDFLLGMGADPRLASLVFQYRKVREAAENQQKGTPAPSTVAQDTSNQYAQLKQQERMRSGLAGMSAPAIANAAMQGGITGQPMQQMAGGGIVAFGKGGRTYTVGPDGEVDIGSAGSLIPYEAPVKPSRSAALRSRLAGGLGTLARFNPIKHPFITAGLLGGAYMLSGDEEEPKQPEAAATVEQVPEGLSEEDIKLIARRDATQGEAPEAALPGIPTAPKFKRPDTSEFKTAIAEAEARVPKNEQEAIDAEMKVLKDAGAFEGIEARRKELAGQKEKATTSPEKKFWLAFAQAGFAASNKGARNLWETLSMGGVEGMKAYETMKEKEAATLEKIADRQFQLDEMLSNKKLTATQAGRKKLDDTRRDLQTLRLQSAAQETAITNAENAFGAQIYGTQAQVAAADRRYQQSRRDRDRMLKLDQAIDDAILKSTDARLTPQERAAYERLATKLMNDRARKESTESGVIAARERLQDQADFMKKRGAYADQNDEFGDLQVE